jgi:hypothetical protein
MNEEDQRELITNSNNNHRNGTMEQSLSRETDSF